MSMSGKGIQLLARYTNAVYDNERDGTNETAYTACKAHGEIEAYISALEAEIKRLKEALRWIPVSERMPDDYLRVLLFIGDYARIGWHSTIDGASWHTESGLWLRGNMGYKSVTHWLELPEVDE